MIYILDSYAWIEYFLGSQKGLKVKNLLEDEKNKVVTVECCLAELKSWALKNNFDFNGYYKVIRADSWIFKVIQPDWLKAADKRREQRKHHKDFGLIDAVLLVKQEELGGKIVSGDKHFKGLKDVVFLG